MQLRKESLKKSGLPWFEPWPLRYRCSALTNWAIKPTGSWSLNWFVIYQGKMKMKLWIYEIHIFELRNEEINVKKILAVINATYAVANRKPEKIRLAGIRTLTSARIFFTFISSFRSSNIWISYIHNFIFIFPGYITNQFNDQLPVGLITQLVRALHRYRRGQGSNPQAWFFQAYIRVNHI